MGEYLREEISGPLGADANIGAKDSELERYSDLIYPSYAGIMFQGMKPKSMGRRFEPNLMEIYQTVKRLLASAKHDSEFEMGCMMCCE
jgi:hypothetical protein